MTGAGRTTKLPHMRALLIFPALLVASVFAVPAMAETRCTPPSPATGHAPADPVDAPLFEPLIEGGGPPSSLAPLADDSPWSARFAAAADALLPALQSRQEGRWRPLLGGRWLGDADRDAVRAMLADGCRAFAPIVDARGPVIRRIFGWRVPSSYSTADRAEMATRPEAEALACWSARPESEAVWPQTAVEADNRYDRPYACARITYSLRGETPAWRAFIELDSGGLAASRR